MRASELRLPRVGEARWPGLRRGFARLLDHRLVPYLVGGFIVALLLLPILFILSTSLKNSSEVFSFPPSYIPENPTLEAYRRMFFASPLPRHLFNSLVISGGTTLVVVGLAVPTTYGIVHYRYRGTGSVLAILLLTRVIPPVALIIPFFVLLTNLRLIDTYAGLILLNVFLTYPLSVWLLKPFFQAFPRELLQAALIDGCSRIRAFTAVVLPLVISGIGAVATFVFLWTWNEFLFALVFSASQKVQPVTVGLRFFIGDEFVQWNRMAAGAMFAALPGIILFGFAQRAIVKGISAGALK